MWIGAHRLVTEADEVVSEKRIAPGSLKGSLFVAAVFAAFLFATSTVAGWSSATAAPAPQSIAATR